MKELMTEEEHALYSLRLAFCNPQLSPALVSKALDIPLELSIEICSRVLGAQIFGFDDEEEDE